MEGNPHLRSGTSGFYGLVMFLSLESSYHQSFCQSSLYFIISGAVCHQYKSLNRDVIFKNLNWPQILELWAICFVNDRAFRISLTVLFWMRRIFLILNKLISLTSLSLCFVLIEHLLFKTSIAVRKNWPLSHQLLTSVDSGYRISTTLTSASWFGIRLSPSPMTQILSGLVIAGYIKKNSRGLNPSCSFLTYHALVEKWLSTSISVVCSKEITFRRQQNVLRKRINAICSR